jgi:hypothetical protein
MDMKISQAKEGIKSFSKLYDSTGRHHEAMIAKAVTLKQMWATRRVPMNYYGS